MRRNHRSIINIHLLISQLIKVEIYFLHLLRFINLITHIIKLRFNYYKNCAAYVKF